MSSFVANSRGISALQEKLVEKALIDPIVVNGLVVICLTLTFTVSDAFNTSDLGFAHRLTLWAVFFVLLVTQLCCLQRGLLLKFSPSLSSRSIATGLAIAITVFLMTVELHWLKYTPLLPKQPDPFLEFLFFVAQPVVAVSCLVLLAQLVSIQRYLDGLQIRQSEGGDSNCDLQELAHITKNYQVLHVSAHDHYLELDCDNHRFFVRGRMKDAISHLTGTEGLQIHRSHWVAKQNIHRVFRQGRDLKLILKNGTKLSVARSKAHLLSHRD